MLKRQVVLRGDARGENGVFKDLTEKEILEKAKIALELMQSDEFQVMEGVEFLHAKKTSNGGVIMMLKTVETATWLRGPGVLGRFAENIGGTATASPTLYMVVAEYVPVSYSPEGYKANAAVELDSGLQRGTIREARYIKKVQFRAQGQRTAHVIMGITDPEQANRAIRDGLVIEGKRVMVRKHKIDPKRCMKCQAVGVNHQAADCKSIHDVCARCAGMHRTDACTVKDANQFKCANCKGQGHGAADRNCRIFREKLHMLHEKLSTYAYKFFPTSDPATWERTDGTTGGEGQRSQDAGWSQVRRTESRRAEQSAGPQQPGPRTGAGWSGPQRQSQMQPPGTGGARGKNAEGSRPTSRQSRMNDFWGTPDGGHGTGRNAGGDRWGDQAHGDGEVGHAQETTHPIHV
jgi:hypothetical protein